jgi:hypothetical protein
MNINNAPYVRNFRRLVMKSLLCCSSSHYGTPFAFAQGDKEASGPKCIRHVASALHGGPDHDVIGNFKNQVEKETTAGEGCHHAMDHSVLKERS